jgi:hypothetical protein
MLLALTSSCGSAGSVWSFLSHEDANSMTAADAIAIIVFAIFIIP